MKYFYLLFLVGLTFVFFNSSSSGPAAVQGRDRTGSPVANGNCSNCHFGGDFGTSVIAQLLKDSVEVDNYIPGETYQFRISIPTTIRPSSYGFQAVALTGEANTTAGTFSNLPENTQVTTINQRDYLENSQRLPDSTYTIDWVAPEVGTGAVRFYAAGNAVNNASGSSGDDPAVLDQALSIAEGAVSSIFNRDALQLEWQVFPNPVQERLFLRVEVPKRQTYTVRIVDLQNRVIQSAPWTVTPGTQNWRAEIDDLIPGIYLVQLISENQIYSRKIVKQ
ncbi:MAG: choice-of-anchor V domain-containing protein [Bacteroidota bacterium]